MTATPAGFRALTDGVSGNLGALRADTPAVMKAFGDLGKASLADGALSKKNKELVALALGVAAHCDPCIGFHMQALVRLGVTKAEVEEVLGVTVYMGGGPSLMYSANAMAAFDELTAKPA